MSFPIQFMYNNQPMNMIPKTPTSKFTVEGVLRDESSIVDPIILIEYSNPVEANYAYIEQFHRYYYVTDWVAVRNGLWRCTMHTDVLKTFSEGILGSPCIIAKTASNDFNLYIPDPNFKRQQNDRYGLVNFPSGFDYDNLRFYLTFFG